MNWKETQEYIKKRYKRVLTRCVAMDCSKDAEVLMTTFQRGKDGKLAHFNTDEFCEEHAYEFSIYYSNCLGLKIKMRKIIPKPETVSFD